VPATAFIAVIGVPWDFAADRLYHWGRLVTPKPVIRVAAQQALFPMFTQSCVGD